jgi:multiple sugar transport system ATP-binding protein
MRAEIKRLHIEQEATTIYVTHDQIEAMAMGDRIVVMSEAVVQQVGSPYEVYHNPSNLFVARFIGSPGMNLMNGHYHEGQVHFEGGHHYAVPSEWKSGIEGQLNSDGDIVMGFRPEAARVSDNEDGQLRSSVYADDLYGGYSMLHLELPDGSIVHARSGRETSHPIGETLRFDIDPQMVRFFDPQTEVALQKGGSA